MSETQEPVYFEQLEKVLKQYLSNRLELWKLQATDKTANLVSVALIALVMAGLVFFVLLFLSIMGGYFFAELTGSFFYGFGIITAFYAVLLTVLFLLRKKYIGPFIVNLLVRVLLEKKTDEDDGEKPLEQS